MWQEGQQAKQIVLEAELNGLHGSDGASSGQAEWGRPAVEGHSHSSGASSSTISDRDNADVVNDPSPRSGSSTPEPSSPVTPVDGAEDLSVFVDPRNPSKLPRKAPHGYELCAACIEIQGIAHARAMAAMDLNVIQGTVSHGELTILPASGGLARRLGAMRHTFRELIWGAKGWKDIGERRCGRYKIGCADWA
jgi:hypothetical protein